MLQYFDKGPRSGGLDGKIQGCRKYWWRNILYINNFYTDPYSEVNADGNHEQYAGVSLYKTLVETKHFY